MGRSDHDWMPRTRRCRGRVAMCRRRSWRGLSGPVDGRRVGSTGHVVAADLDVRFLTGLPDNVTVRNLDIRTESLEAAGFDLVHCRFLLEHMAGPQAVVNQLASAVRPGGVLLVEEFDFGLFHFDGHPDASRMNAIFARVGATTRDTKVVDIYMGRGLPAMLQTAGLEFVDSAISVEVVEAGHPRFESNRMNEEMTWPILVRLGIIDESEATLLRSFHDGDHSTIVTTPALVAAWARRPSSTRDCSRPTPRLRERSARDRGGGVTATASGPKSVRIGQSPVIDAANARNWTRMADCPRVQRCAARGNRWARGNHRSFRWCRRHRRRPPSCGRAPGHALGDRVDHGTGRRPDRARDEHHRLAHAPRPPTNRPEGRPAGVRRLGGHRRLCPDLWRTGGRPDGVLGRRCGHRDDARRADPGRVADPPQVRQPAVRRDQPSAARHGMAWVVREGAALPGPRSHRETSRTR